MTLNWLAALFITCLAIHGLATGQPTSVVSAQLSMAGLNLWAAYGFAPFGEPA